MDNYTNPILNLIHTQNNIPPTARQSNKRSPPRRYRKKIVLIVVDGFGFDQFLKQHKQNPFLKPRSNGDVSPITSLYHRGSNSLSGDNMTAKQRRKVGTVCGCKVM
jgi:hypothetical protein